MTDMTAWFNKIMAKFYTMLHSLLVSLGLSNPNSCGGEMEELPEAPPTDDALLP